MACLEAEGIDRMQSKGMLYGAARTEAKNVIGKNVFIVGGAIPQVKPRCFSPGTPRRSRFLCAAVQQVTRFLQS